MSTNTLVFTIATGGYDHLFSQCLSTQKDYSERWGYEYLVVREAARKLSATEAAWLKIPLTRLALEAGYEWVAFIDADCGVHKQAPCFVSEFSQYGDDKSLFMSRGFSGRINSGVIFARNTPQAWQYFADIQAMADQQVPPEDEAPYENGHAIHLGKNNPAVQMLDYRLWNNNSCLDDNSYIQHYSGGRLRKWYLAKLAPPELRQSRYTFKRLFHNIRRTVMGRPRSSQLKETCISKSLDELVPQLTKTYSQFQPKSRAA